MLDLRIDLLGPLSVQLQTLSIMVKARQIKIDYITGTSDTCLGDSLYSDSFWVQKKDLLIPFTCTKNNLIE